MERLSFSLFFVLAFFTAYNLFGEEKIIEQDIGIVKFPDQVFLLSDIQILLSDLKLYREKSPHSLLLHSLKLSQEFYPHLPDLNLQSLSQNELFLDQLLALLKLFFYHGNQRSFKLEESYRHKESDKHLFLPFFFRSDSFLKNRFGESAVVFSDKEFQQFAAMHQGPSGDSLREKYRRVKQDEMIQGLLQSLNKQIQHTFLWK